MDYNNINENNPINNDMPDLNNQQNQSGSSMALVSMILGISSIAALCCCGVPFITGGIGITLALLSKGKSSRLLTQAKTGLILSIIGVVLSLTICIASIVYVLNTPEFMEQYKQTYEDIYGEDTFPDSLEDFQTLPDSPLSPMDL